MGGGQFATELLAAGVLDEISLNVHPVVLGAGVPLFLDGVTDDAETFQLEVIEVLPVLDGSGNEIAPANATVADGSGTGTITVGRPSRSARQRVASRSTSRRGCQRRIPPTGTRSP